MPVVWCYGFQVKHGAFWNSTLTYNEKGHFSVRRLFAHQRVANESPSIERFPISVSITPAVPERL